MKIQSENINLSCFRIIEKTSHRNCRYSLTEIFLIEMRKKLKNKINAIFVFVLFLAVMKIFSMTLLRISFCWCACFSFEIYCDLFEFICLRANASVEWTNIEVPPNIAVCVILFVNLRLEIEHNEPKISIKTWVTNKKKCYDFIFLSLGLILASLLQKKSKNLILCVFSIKANS